MIFGTVAWDHPIWLDQSLKSGGRILGLRDQTGTDGLSGGRLGGGAANAAACLSNAGHKTAVWSTIGDDEIGTQIKHKLTDLGVECTHLKSMPAIAGTTWILIAPDGERTILFEHSDQDLSHTLRRQQKQVCGKIDINTVRTFQPDGIYLRSLFTDFAELHDIPDALIVTHWPQSPGEDRLPADILIGSRDDLIATDLCDSPFEAARAVCSERLKYVIITDGPRGGEVFSQHERFGFRAPVVDQVDATGAGDAFAAGVLEAMAHGADISSAIDHGASWGATTAALKGCAERRAVGTYSSWSLSRAL